MKELGISIYPFHSSMEENKNYLKLASKYGYKRVFTCLLSVDGDKDLIIKEFKRVEEYLELTNNKLEVELKLLKIREKILNI